MLSVTLYRRDFSSRLPVTVDLNVHSLSWMAVGGPDEAVLHASGSPAALWELVELLRCPVEICDRRAEPVWCGYVHAIQTGAAGLAIAASLESMANRVQVTYTASQPGSDLHGERASTAWVEDGESISTYGAKELRLSIGAASPDQAAAQASGELSARRYPLPGVHLRPSPAVVHCRGWWHTLDWLYHTQPAGREASPTGGSLLKIGAQPAAQVLAQSFSLGSSTAWLADRLRLHLKQIGAPADDLLAELAADSAGVPGGVLASASFSAAQLSPGLRLEELVFSPRAALTSGQAYWLILRRSGGVDPLRYGSIDADLSSGGGSYPRGSLWVWDGSGWTPHSPAADLRFDLLGVEETSSQLARMLVSQPLITAVDLDLASEVFSSQYRSGDQRLRAEVEALLTSGTCDGRRLLAAVGPQRRVRIYPQPNPGEADLGLLPDGAFTDRFGQPLPAERGPIAAWLKVRGLVPSSADFSRLADPSRVWLERLVWREGKVEINP